MATTLKKSLAGLTAGGLLLLVLSGLPGDSLAATLTGGNYTYVIDGEEVSFQIDPISRKDGLIMPVEVLQRFNINIEGALTRKVTLSRGEVTAKITLGSTLAEINGQRKTLATAALRLSGRLFVPTDLLRFFGIDFSVDGTYLTMKDQTTETPATRALPESDYNTLKAGRTFTTTAKADTNIYLNGDFTLLNEELVAAANFAISYEDRLKLHNLLKTNSLVLVKLSNSYFKSGGLTTSGLFLVDAEHRQYDLASVLDIGDGMVNVKVAPSAERTGVLVFPKIRALAGSVSLYYDLSQGNLGSFSAP